VFIGIVMAANGFITVSIREETVEKAKALINKDDRNIDSVPKVIDVAINNETKRVQQ